MIKLTVRNRPKTGLNKRKVSYGGVMYVGYKYIGKTLIALPPEKYNKLIQNTKKLKKIIKLIGRKYGIPKYAAC